MAFAKSLKSEKSKARGAESPAPMSKRVIPIGRAKRI